MICADIGYMEVDCTTAVGVDTTDMLTLNFNMSVDEDVERRRHNVSGSGEQDYGGRMLAFLAGTHPEVDATPSSYSPPLQPQLSLHRLPARRAVTRHGGQLGTSSPPPNDIPRPISRNLGVAYTKHSRPDH